MEDPHASRIHTWWAAGGSRVVHSASTTEPISFARAKAGFLQDVEDGGQMINARFPEHMNNTDWIHSRQELYAWSLRQADNTYIKPATTAIGELADWNCIEPDVNPELFVDGRDPDFCLEKEKEFATYVYRAECKSKAKFEGIVYIFFLVVVLWGGFARAPYNFFTQNQALASVLVEGTVYPTSYANHISTFETIHSLADLRSWFTTLPIPELKSDGRYYIFDDQVLMGGYEFRLLIEEEVSCPEVFNLDSLWTDKGKLAAEVLTSLNRSCYGGWRTGGQFMDVWEYEGADAYQGNTFSDYAATYSTKTMQWYPAGGYRRLLPAQNFESSVKEISTEPFMFTPGLRAWFVEFSIYNPSTGALTAAKLLYESTADGAVFTSYTLTSFHIDNDWTWRGPGDAGDYGRLPLCLWQVTLILLLTYETVQMVRHVKTVGFSDWWTELRGNPQVVRLHHLKMIKEVFDELEMSAENRVAVDRVYKERKERYQSDVAPEFLQSAPENSVNRSMLFDRLIVAVKMQPLLTTRAYAGSPCYGSFFYWSLYRSHRWNITWSELVEYFEVLDTQTWALDYDSAIFTHLDILNLIMLWTGFLMRLATLSKDLVRNYDYDYASANYVDIQSLAQYTDFVRVFYGINIMITMFKALKYLQVQSDVNSVWQTFVRGFSTFAAFAVIFLTLMMAFTIAAMILFGAQLPEFSYIYRAFCSMLLGIMGKIDYDSMYAVMPVYGVVFTTAFLLIIVVVQVNMLLSIMCTVYRKNEEEKGRAVASVLFAIRLEDKRIIAEANKRHEYLTTEMAREKVPVILKDEVASVTSAVKRFVFSIKVVILNYLRRETKAVEEPEPESGSDVEVEEDDSRPAYVDYATSLDEERQRKIREYATHGLFSSLTGGNSVARAPTPPRAGPHRGPEPMAPETYAEHMAPHASQTLCETEEEFRLELFAMRAHYSTLMSDTGSWEDQQHEHEEAAEELQNLARDAKEKGFIDVAKELQNTAKGILSTLHVHGSAEDWWYI